jgi:hypothetical protein
MRTGILKSIYIQNDPLHVSSAHVAIFSEVWEEFLSDNFPVCTLEELKQHPHLSCWIEAVVIPLLASSKDRSSSDSCSLSS